MSARVRRLRVTAPEGVEFSFRIASPVLRLGALMIDWALISSAWSIVALLLKPLQLISEDAGRGMLIVAYFALSRGYDVVMDYNWRGQTVGKRVMRLRVVDARGFSLTFAQCVMRNLLRFVDCLPVAYAVGGITSLVSARGQRLGDLAAGTIVVHEAIEPVPDATVMAGQRYNSLRSQAALVARLRRESSPEEARAAWQALARREQLEPAARLELYADLADHFRRLGHISDELLDGLTDEQQVRNVVDVLYQQRD